MASPPRTTSSPRPTTSRRQIVIGRGKVDDDAIARARQAGYSSSEILEIVAECTFAGLVGVVDNLAGRVKLDEFLTPRAWG